jgi:excisionase family DNA binding protein
LLLRPFDPGPNASIPCVGEGRTRPDLDRLTLVEAADALGVSQDAVRKRIARGTIPHNRDESGRVHVYLLPSETVHETDQDTIRDDVSKTVQDVYVRSLEDQIAFLRGELERKAAILLNLTDRIPQLEASESPRTAEDASEEAEPRSAAGGSQEPVWRRLRRRMFGG